MPLMPLTLLSRLPELVPPTLLFGFSIGRFSMNYPALPARVPTNFGRGGVAQDWVSPGMYATYFLSSLSVVWIGSSAALLLISEPLQALAISAVASGVMGCLSTSFQQIEKIALNRQKLFSAPRMFGYGGIFAALGMFVSLQPQIVSYLTPRIHWHV